MVKHIKFLAFINITPRSLRVLVLPQPIPISLLKFKTKQFVSKQTDSSLRFICDNSITAII